MKTGRACLINTSKYSPPNTHTREPLKYSSSSSTSHRHTPFECKLMALNHGCVWRQCTHTLVWRREMPRTRVRAAPAPRINDVLTHSTSHQNIYASSSVTSGACACVCVLAYHRNFTYSRTCCCKSMRTSHTHAHTRTNALDCTRAPVYNKTFNK